MSSDIRRPVVAGQFYPAGKDELLAEIRRCFHDKKIGPGVSIRGDSRRAQTRARSNRIECFVVPHAGYPYSGPVAAHSYSLAYDILTSREEILKAIIIGPNHQGIGSGIALSPSNAWETPLGNVKIDAKLSKEISDSSEIIDIDGLAHSYEHSIEVQLPFLQDITEDRQLSFVPICLMLQDRESAEEVANAIFKVIQSEEYRSDSFLILGSSDLTHYEPQSRANAQDGKLLGKIETLDLLSYYSTLERNNVTACGYGAIAVVMELSKKLGKTSGTVLKYATSGDATGDMSSVVGYSAVHFV
ncbi:MAG: AmmeMemoRadiSam system protein B [archaeon]|nr:AmmeMemoRadiSam system protein B [archaeon]